MGVVVAVVAVVMMGVLGGFSFPQGSMSHHHWDFVSHSSKSCSPLHLQLHLRGQC